MPQTATTPNHEEVLRAAHDLFSKGIDWATFYREVLGLEGIARRAFPSQDSLAQFERTPAYGEILHMLTKLRRSGSPPSEEEEPTRVVTVRLPKSLHESLRIEADEHHTSMNKLCISKLLQFIADERVPARP